VFQVIQSRLDDVLVVQKGFGIADSSEPGLADVMLLAHVVVPINALGQEAVRAVVMLGDGEKDDLAADFILATLPRLAPASVNGRLEIRESRLGVSLMDKVCDFVQETRRFTYPSFFPR